MISVVSSDTVAAPQVVVGTVWLPLEGLQNCNLFHSEVPALRTLMQIVSEGYHHTRFFYGVSIVRDGMYSWVRPGHLYSRCSSNGRVFAFLYNEGHAACVDVCVMREGGSRPIIDRLAKLMLSDTPVSILIRPRSPTYMGIVVSSLPKMTLNSIAEVEITSAAARIFI